MMEAVVESSKLFEEKGKGESLKQLKLKWRMVNP